MDYSGETLWPFMKSHIYNSNWESPFLLSLLINSLLIISSTLSTPVFLLLLCAWRGVVQISYRDPSLNSTYEYMYYTGWDECLELFEPRYRALLLEEMFLIWFPGWQVVYPPHGVMHSNHLPFHQMRAWKLRSSRVAWPQPWSAGIHYDNKGNHNVYNNCKYPYFAWTSLHCSACYHWQS